MDLLSDLKTDDLQIVNGDLEIANRAQSNGQRINARLKTFVGEWFLDLEFGIDYFNDVLVKNPQIQFVSGIIKAAILQSADAGAIVEDFETDFDTSARKLTARYSVKLDGGEVIQNAIVLG